MGQGPLRVELITNISTPAPFPMAPFPMSACRWAMKLRDITIPGFCAPLMLLLASCSSIQPFPAGWGNLDEGKLIGECPAISGAYIEHGQRNSSCFDEDQPCHLLSYALLSGGISYKEALGGEKYPWPRNSQQVRLNQPNDRTLKISVLNSQGEPVREESLSRDDGDFSCDGEKLKLKKRLIFYSIVMSNMVGSISRSFSLSSDGALVMESKTSIVVQDLILVLQGTFNNWVRWPPVEPPEVRAEREKREKALLAEQATRGDVKAAFELAREFKDLQYLRQLAVAGNVEAASILAERFSEKASLYDLAEKGNVDAAVELASGYGDHKPLKDLADSGNRQAAEAFNRISCDRIYYKADDSAKEQVSDRFVQVCEESELSDRETIKVFADWGPPEGARYRTYFKITPEALK